ncbi:MAG: hypothetical protein QXQ48_08410 [Nitrososphaerota archaeon]
MIKGRAALPLVLCIMVALMLLKPAAFSEENIRVTLVDGHLIRLMSAWEYKTEEEVLSGRWPTVFELEPKPTDKKYVYVSKNLRPSEIGLGGRATDVILEAEFTEVYGNSFRLLILTPMEFELWKNAKPYNALLERDCEWRCQIKLPLNNTTDIKLVYGGKDKAPAVTAKLVWKYWVFYPSKADPSRWMPDTLVRYYTVIPVIAGTHVVISGRFESSAPIMFAITEEPEIEKAQKIFFKSIDSHKQFSFEYVAKNDYPTLYIIAHNSQREVAYVKVWLSANWYGKPLRIFETVEKTGVVKLGPALIKKVEDKSDLIQIKSNEFWRSFSLCPNGQNHLFELVAEEPGGLEFSVAVLDRYEYQIFRDRVPMISNDPSPAIPILRPILKLGPSSKIDFKLDISKCIYFLFLRHSPGNLIIKLNTKNSWFEPNIPTMWSRGSRIYAEAIESIEAPPSLAGYIVEGEFVSDKPFSAEISVSDIFALLRPFDALYFNVVNFTSAKFGFPVFSEFFPFIKTSLPVRFKNPNNEPMEVKIKVKVHMLEVAKDGKTSPPTTLVTRTPVAGSPMTQFTTKTYETTAATNTGTTIQPLEISNVLPILLSAIAGLITFLLLMIIRLHRKKSNS